MFFDNSYLCWYLCLYLSSNLCIIGIKLIRYGKSYLVQKPKKKLLCIMLPSALILACMFVNQRLKTNRDFWIILERPQTFKHCCKLFSNFSFRAHTDTAISTCKYRSCFLTCSLNLGYNILFQISILCQVDCYEVAYFLLVVQLLLEASFCVSNPTCIGPKLDTPQEYLCNSNIEELHS